MTTKHCKSIAEFQSMLRRDMKSRQRRVTRVVMRVAKRVEKHVRTKTIPVAFGELRDSLHTEGTAKGGARVIADAPYAEAVENGSRPHVVPLEALIAWVKLRGMQGLTDTGRVKRAPKPGTRSRSFDDGATTAKHARSIASQLKAMTRRKTRKSGRHLEADAPTQIAKAIQAKIAKFGTKPTWFMFQAVPQAEPALDDLMPKALQD